MEQRPRRARVISIWAGAAIVLSLLAVALVFSNAYGASRVAANARGLHLTNAAAGSSALARIAAAQAVVFAVDAEAGLADGEASSIALEEARRARDAAAAALGAIEVPSDAFVRAVDGVLDGLGSDDIAAASASLTDLESEYGPLEIRIRSLQDQFASTIERTEETAGLVGTVTRWLVALFIPGATFVVYRSLVRRQARRREDRLQARLEAERRLRKARDEFIAGVSHELRTPLTSIYGFSEVLLDQGLVDPEESLDLIGLINNESANLSRMVDDLLVSARLDAGSLKLSMDRVVVADEIEAVVGPYRRAGESITVTDVGHAVRADRERLRHVLRNLVDNACRHGGEQVWVRGMVQEGRVTVAVADDGAGVPADVLPRLFEPFVQDAPVEAGSVGMGLATAKRIAEAMGGDIRHARVNDITVFVLVLSPDLPVGSAIDVAGGAFDLAAAT
jgi:signal transduction histidine kinase